MSWHYLALWHYSIIGNSKNLTPNRKCPVTIWHYLIESDSIAHTERDNCSRPIKSRTDEERDLVAVVEVARDRRVDPDRTCCRSMTPQFMTNWLGSYMLLGVAPAVATLSAPCSCPLRDIHERPEEVAFCAAAPARHHLLLRR